MARARDKVHTVTDELKNCYLLLAADDEDSIKLHDIVRDVCLSIASSDEQMYMVRQVRLKEWPQEENYAHYTAISLTFDEIDELPSGLEYPKLKILRLNFKEHKLHIPEDFFKGMNKLEVLEIYYLESELPLSLQPLVDLQTLCFDGCSLYGGISGIGSLRKLEILSFYSSFLDRFPDEIVVLSNLKCLDLRFQLKGPLLPRGVLLRLKKVEELYLGSYFQEWNRKGVEAYSGIVAEVSSLQNLQTVQFRANDDYCLEQMLENIHSKKLIRFRIIRSIDDRYIRGFPFSKVKEFQFSKVLALHNINVDLLSKPPVRTLLWKTEHLSLTVKGLTNIVNKLDVKGFVNLKKLNMDDCDIKYLVDTTNLVISGGVFTSLEELLGEDANNLEELCHGNLPPGSFARLRVVRLSMIPGLRRLWGEIQHPCLGNLRILKIEYCDSIRSLFLQSSLKCLCQLQEMSIRRCSKLETLILNDEGDDKDTRNIEFPKVEILDFFLLESFRSFSPGLDQEALFRKVIFANLRNLKIMNVHGKRCIVDNQVPIGSLSKLQTMVLEDCGGLEVIFDFTGLNVEGANIENLLGQLESLWLKNLFILKHLWRMLPEGIHAFKNLRELQIHGFHELSYLLTPSMATMLVGLETLRIVSCRAMKAIIGRVERLISEIESEEDTKKKEDGEETAHKIHLPKLRRLGVGFLFENFRMLCSENIDLQLLP